MTQWTSWDEFFRMGGYGLYVWGSYAVTLAVMLVEPLSARARQRRALAQVAEAAAQTDSGGSAAISGARS